MSTPEVYTRIKEFSQHFRNQIEPHWTSDLLYEKFSKNSDDTASAGYCGPSSVLLLKKLVIEFPEEVFSLAVGKVYSNSTEWIRGKHVWVVWHQALKGATIIDVTADQSGKIKDKIIVQTVDRLATEGINYLPYQLAHSYDEIDKSPKSRAALLESRLD